MKTKISPGKYRITTPSGQTYQIENVSADLGIPRPQWNISPIKGGKVENPIDCCGTLDSAIWLVHKYEGIELTAK